MGVGARVAVEKLRTCLPDVDLSAYGGLPKRGTTLVVRMTGGARATVTTQFLTADLAHTDAPGMFVTGALGKLNKVKFLFETDPVSDPFPFVSKEGYVKRGR